MYDYDDTTWHLIELARRRAFLERKTEQFGADTYKRREIEALVWVIETLGAIPDLADAIATAEAHVAAQEEARRKA